MLQLSDHQVLVPEVVTRLKTLEDQHIVCLVAFRPCNYLTRFNTLMEPCLSDHAVLDPEVVRRLNTLMEP